MNTWVKPLLILIAALLLLACDSSGTKQRELSDFVPENAFVTYKIKNFQSLKSDLENNGSASHYASTEAYKYFATQHPLFSKLHVSTPSLLSLTRRNDSVIDYTFATHHANLVGLDSLPNKKLETLTIGGRELQKITIEKAVAYTAIIDSIFVASSSQMELQQLHEGKSNTNASFKKAFAVKDGSDLSVVYQSPSISLREATQTRLASHMSLEISLLPNAVKATGVALVQDTVPQLLSVFAGQTPQQNEIGTVVPVTATQVTAFTYSNASSFLSQLSNFRSDTAPTTIPTLFETVSEIGEISLPAGTAIALKSIDPQLTADALASSLTQMGTFREVTLYSFAAPDFFHDYLKPLINFKQASVAFQLDSFFIVAENETVAQEIISCATSGTCLSQAPFFSETSAQLSTASSLLRLSLQGSVAESVSRQMESLFGMPSLTESLPNYPLTAHQFTYDRNFAHVTFLCQESRATGPALTGGISESFTLQLENGVLMPPQFFSNHRTGGHDIVVQDMANKLYLLSSEGKTLWKKQLDNPVLGGIEEVDLLRNGNKQFAFATKNKVYVLDRTGASVGSFPLQFKDAITQPLSVFDYDNNRKYRFVVTQGDNVLMYGPDGKMIRGFSFKKAKSEIVLPPQHIRMGNKDYIAIAEKNGSLNLLHRTGRIRVPLASKFQFSEIPIAEEGNAFVVITADNNKVSITQEGKTSSQALNVSGNYWFTTLGRTKATLDDNLLRINGNLAELPFGVYTPPKIVQIGKQQLITLTETQENKVYVFTTEATLLPGFPVYGTSIAALRQGSSGERAQLVVAGPNKEIILYSWSF